MRKLIYPLLALVLLAACDPFVATDSGRNNRRNSGDPSVPNEPGNPQEPGEPQAPHEPQNPQEPEEPPQNAFQVCYKKACFPLTSIVKIEDPKKDYVYPDPKDFSDPKMRPQYISPVAFIDLKGIDPETQITDHFKLGEFLSEAKGRYGVLTRTLVEKLQSIRTALNKSVTVNSAYRSPGYNSRTDGSAKWSRHMYGDAVDFKVAGLKPQDLVKYCTDLGAGFYQLYSTHIHCDWRKSQLDDAFYISDSKIDVQGLPSQKSIIEAAKRNVVLSSNIEKKKIVIKAELLEVEDEGHDLLYEWVVTAPDGKRHTSKKSSISLPLQKGVFNIQVSIGGSIQLEETLIW